MEKNKIQHLNITTDKLFDDIRNIIEQGRLIKTLAEQLVPKYGATFCKRNLDYFRQFYLCFNDLERLYRLQTLRPKSGM